MKRTSKSMCNCDSIARLPSISSIILICAFWGHIADVDAEEPLDFIAEHILEVPMDIRYQSFPKIPDDWTSPSKWIQIGAGEVSGGKMTSRFPMIAVNIYRPSDPNSGWLFSLFYENYQFSGRNGATLLRPSFGSPNYLPTEFEVDVNNINGSGYHFGGSVSYAFNWSWGGKIQLGIALEQLKIDHFKVEFNSIGLPVNFAGSVDYASTYNVFTPFVSYQFDSQQLSENWRGSASFILTLPGPRRGFKGRFEGPGFDIDSDTDAIGGGKHIPDKYLGFSYLVVHRPSGITMNIGGSLYSFLLEPLAHKDTDAPLFLTLSKTF